MTADPTLLRRAAVEPALQRGQVLRGGHADHGADLSTDGQRAGSRSSTGASGLGPNEAAHAFEPFWRAKPGTSRTRGTGIGLALVRDYVRLMGGDVGVRSEPGVGLDLLVHPASGWALSPRRAAGPARRYCVS